MMKKLLYGILALSLLLAVTAVVFGQDEGAAEFEFTEEQIDRKSVV